MSLSVKDVVLRFALAFGFVVSCADRAQAENSPAAEFMSASASPSAAVWTQRRIYTGVAYFLDNTGPRIRRYKADSAAWLADIALPTGADAFDIDASGIYVKFADRVERYTLDGASHSTVPSVQGDGSLLEISGNALVIGNQQNVLSYNKTTGALISRLYLGYSMIGTSHIESEGRIFGNAEYYPSSNILKLTINRTTGAILSVVNDPYQKVFPDSTVTYARAAGGLVLDNAGTVYESTTLKYLGNLGGAILGVAFLADRFVVMRGAELVVFSNDVRELGRIDAPAGTLDIMAIGDMLYAVAGSIGALAIVPLNVDAARPAVPPPARDWSETNAKADFIMGDATGLVFVSKVEHAAYAFNPVSWAFEQTIPLFVSPLYATYSPTTKHVYASYEGGGIYSFPLQLPRVATWLASTPYSAFGLAVAGEYVFAADSTAPWASHYTFSPAGTALSRIDWNYYSRQYEWDPIKRRMYFFQDGFSPNNLHWERIAVDGTIAAAGESPYHGQVQAATPIRVSPDGARVVLGSGQVFESGGLTLIGNLGQSAAEITWSNGDLYAITGADTPKLQRYGSNYQVVSSGRVRGTPRRLVPSTSGFVYLADVGPTTIIGRLDTFLSQADLAVDPVAPGAVFANGSVVNLAVSVGNNGTVPANGATVRASLAELEDTSWRCVPTALVTGCAGATGNAAINNSIDLADGGQAVYEIKGRIPASARNEVVISIEIVPAVTGSDPELRNNTQTVRLKLDRLFDDGLE